VVLNKTFLLMYQVPTSLFTLLCKIFSMRSIYSIYVSLVFTKFAPNISCFTMVLHCQVFKSWFTLMISPFFSFIYRNDICGIFSSIVTIYVCCVDHRTLIICHILRLCVLHLSVCFYKSRVTLYSISYTFPFNNLISGWH